MIHLQYNTPGWSEALSRLPDGSLIKLVDMVQTAAEVKGINPRLKVLLRHVNNEGYIWSLDWSANVTQAEAEFRTYIDGTFANYAHLVDYVEEPRNEYVDNGMSSTEVAKRVMWARACAYVWKSVFQPIFPHIQCLIGAQPVGNDIPLGFFKAAHDYGAGISTHAYVKFNSLGVRDAQDFLYHSGRWANDDLIARGQGYNVPIAVTETGPYDGTTWNGWRAPNVLGGNVDWYVTTMKNVIRDWAQTNAYRTGRLLGFNLFTTIRDGWTLYQTNQPELNALADMVRAEWKPGTTLPPPPPPEPHTWRKHVILASQRTTPDQYDYLREVAYPTKTEIAFSADSAFARPSNVTGHSVDVYDVDGWGGRPALEAWVAQHYSYNPPTDVRWYDYPPASGFRLTHWPSISRYITQAFGANPEIYQQYGLPGHDGVDIAAPQDTVIKAAAAGKVIRADYHSNYGYHVRLEHEGGEYHTIYAHLAPDLNVTVDQDVPGGYKLGYSGNTGNSTGYHLHFGMKRFPVGMAGWPYNLIDPTPYLNQL